MLIEPLPEADVQLPPPVAAHVHVAAVKEAGSVSTTVAPTMAEGPELVTVTV